MGTRKDPHPKLTAKERQVMELYVQGFSRDRIAEQLKMTETTTRYFINHSLMKARRIFEPPGDGDGPKDRGPA